MVAAFLFAVLPAFAKYQDVPYYLLSSPEVRRDLGLSHEAGVKIDDLFDLADEMDGKTIRPPRDAKKIAELKKKGMTSFGLREQTLAYVDGRQAERLRQYEWQRNEAWLLNDPKMVKRIGVSPEVVRKVKAAQEREFADWQKRSVGSDARLSKNISAAKRERILAGARKTWDQSQLRCKEILYHALTLSHRERMRSVLGRPFDLNKIHFRGQPTMVAGHYGA